MKGSPMRRTHLITIVTALSFTQIGCATTLASRWAGERVKLDGNPDDWEGVPFRAIADSSLTVAVQNDAENLYLYLCTGDPRFVHLSKRLGITVWLKEHGDREAERGFKFWPASEEGPDADDSPRFPPITQMNPAPTISQGPHLVER